METTAVSNCVLLQPFNGYLNGNAKCFFFNLRVPQELKKVENAVCMEYEKTN